MAQTPDEVDAAFNALMRANHMHDVLGGVADFVYETPDLLIERYRRLGEIGEESFMQGELHIAFEDAKAIMTPVVETQVGNLLRCEQQGLERVYFIVIQGSYLPSADFPFHTLSDEQKERIHEISSAMRPNDIPKIVEDRNRLLGLVTPRSICSDAYLITRSARPAIDFLKAIPGVGEGEEYAQIKSGNFAQTSSDRDPDAVYWIGDQVWMPRQRVRAARVMVNGETIDSF